jgi:biotin carboxylase
MPFANAARFTDKRLMKRAAMDAGIPVTPWRELGPGVDARALVAELGLPLVLKLPRSSGSRGQVVAQSLEEVAAALPGAALAERFVHGREMSIESFVSGGELIFANPTEYLLPLHASIVAAPPTAAGDWEAARQLSARVLDAFGFERGMAHLELFLTDQGPVLGEVAARPPGGRLMPLLLRAYGFDPWETLLRIELGRPVSLPRAPRRCAGAWMLHPGAGLVSGVDGLEAARAVPGIRRVRLRVRPGDRIDVRIGSGQDIGYLQAEGPHRDAVAAALVEAHRLVRVQLA